MSKTNIDVDQVITDVLENLPSGRHPDTERLEQEAMAWFDQQHLPDLSAARRAKMRTFQFALGVGAAFPSASYEAVYWWSKFTFWYMIFEDSYAETVAAQDLRQYLRHAGELWRTTHDTLPTENSQAPLADLLATLLCELDTLVPDVVATRIRHALRDYLFAAAWEAAVPTTRMPFDSAEYRSFRRHFGLGVLNIEFIEHLPGLLLTEHQRRDPRIHRIRALACDIMNDINDLCSLGFEISNDIALLPASAAEIDHLTTLAGLCRNNTTTLLDLVDSVVPHPTLHGYSNAVIHWVSGSVWWNQQARMHRYRSDDL